MRTYYVDIHVLRRAGACGFVRRAWRTVYGDEQVLVNYENIRKFTAPRDDTRYWRGTKRYRAEIDLSQTSLWIFSRLYRRGLISQKEFDGLYNLYSDIFCRRNHSAAQNKRIDRFAKAADALIKKLGTRDTRTFISPMLGYR